MLAISKAEGTGALFKGCVLNWAKLAPSAGLSFYFYEVFVVDPFQPRLRVLKPSVCVSEAHATSFRWLAGWVAVVDPRET